MRKYLIVILVIIILMLSGCLGGDNPVNQNNSSDMNNTDTTNNTEPDENESDDNVNVSEFTDENETINDRLIVNGQSQQYQSIQAAIDDVDDGGLVVIKSGRYSGDIEIDKNITLAGDGDVIIGGEEPSSSVGIMIDGDSEVEISNLEVVGFHEGINADGTNSEWEISNVTLRKTTFGIRAARSQGGWLIEDSSFRNNMYGLHSPRVDEQWKVHTSEFSNNDYAIRAHHTETARVNNSVVRDNEVAFGFTSSDGEDIYLRYNTIVDNELIIDAKHSSGRLNAQYNWWGQEAGLPIDQSGPNQIDQPYIGSVNSNFPCSEPCAQN
jgi:hypothetical protein